MAPLPPTRERPDVFVAHGSNGAAPSPKVPTPRSRRRRIAKLVFFGTAVLLAVTLGAVAMAAYLTKKGINELVTPKSEATRAAQAQLAEALPGKPATVLVMGSDHRAGFDQADRRSDTMLLVRLDPQKKTVSMMSFPRDLYVNIPGKGNAKINDAFYLGGPKLAVQTVKELTDIDVNFIMVVDFRGFRQLVSTLGGVWVDVDRRYLNEGGNYAAIDIEPGYQLLDGKNALAYARYRHTDSDFHRIARQQLLLAALKKQASRSRVSKNLPGLFRAIYENTDMATGGNGKISSRTVISYMRLALSPSARNVYQVELDGEVGMTDQGLSIVQADPAKIQAAVNSFLNPDTDAQQQTADQVTGQPGGARKPAAAAANITVEVKNGNGIPGAAGTTADSLRKFGYKVTVRPGAAGNADTTNYANTRVQYRDDADRQVAESIAQSFPQATVEKWNQRNRTRARILVIVGRAGARPASAPAGSVTESNKVPRKAPPNVVRDREYGLAEMQELRGATANLPIMYPTVRERTSTFEFPVKPYLIVKGRQRYWSYRLVAKTAAADYWGFQATTWPDPPILDEPTRETQRAGRNYMLFFNGTKLHMVAWRENGAVYWVSNSVLDKLSNETMLAIADGVRPIRR